MSGHIITASGGCGQALRILPEMFSTIRSLPLNRTNLAFDRESTHPRKSGGKTLLHRDRIRPSSLARLSFTGNLAALQRILQKVLTRTWSWNIVRAFSSPRSSSCVHSHAASLTANHRLKPCSREDFSTWSKVTSGIVKAGCRLRRYRFLDSADHLSSARPRTNSFRNSLQRLCPICFSLSLSPKKTRSNATTS